MTDTESIGTWSDVGSLDRKSHLSLERDEVGEAAHQEHLRLAGIVKGVHADLRKKYKKSNGEPELEKIWSEHCQNKQILSQYADAMHHLAIDHWSKNNQETRIDWCRDVVIEYFNQDGLKKVLEKEKRRKESHQKQRESTDNASVDPVSVCDDKKQELKNGCETDTSDDLLEKTSTHPETVESGDQNSIDKPIDSNGASSDDNMPADCNGASLGDNSVSSLPNESCSGCQGMTDSAGATKHFIKREYNRVEVPVQGRIRLLDVGSCFNPFLAFPEFQPIGIDISPAAETVYHCDFLHLRTTDPLQVANDTMTAFINNLKDPVEWLPRECFHVVVFSLLLEYFPAPYQRWVSCQKAHELLMYNGILVIVTPDSSHQNRNAGMMKSWKVAIESLGFKRWRYVKQEHLHCMVFRKVEITEEEKRSSFLRGITADMLYIPQDFHDIPDETSDACQYSYEDEQFYKNYTLHELPVLLSDSDDNDV